MKVALKMHDHSSANYLYSTVQHGSYLLDDDMCNLQDLLRVVINKYKYDEGHNFESQVSHYTLLSVMKCLFIFSNFLNYV